MATWHKEGNVRPWSILVAIIGLCSGCTSVALERNTVKQASTLTDLQYQQVLDNLAMFACNPDAMAWHLKLNSGTVQVTDQVSGAFLASLPSAVSDSVKYLFQPSAAAQRGLVGQWNVIPTVDPDDLQALQLAYQKAIYPLDEEGKIRDAIYDQICEMTVKYDILLDHETIDKLIEHMKRKKDASTQQYSETEEEFNARKWDLKRKFHELQKELDEQFDRIAEISKVTQKNLEKATTREQRYEAQSKAQAQKTEVMQYRVGVEDQIVKLIREICDLPYIPRYPATGRGEHNPAVIGQIQDKIKALVDLAEEPKFAIPWVCVGKKKNVPKCACYVGHYCNCGCDCYVWVMPEHRANLRDFTLTVLNLAPLETSEMPGFFPGGGVIFSPTTSGGGAGFRIP